MLLQSNWYTVRSDCIERREHDSFVACGLSREAVLESRPWGRANTKGFFSATTACVWVGAVSLCGTFC